MASRASRPPCEPGQLVQEVLVLDVLQKSHHVRMRADHVRDVQQRQPHFRRDVVGDGLRERVGRVLLAQPRLQLVVEPPGGLHRRHEHLMASRIEQDPPQLLEVRQDEVEERRSGLRPDVALHGGDGGLAALDQLGDDGRIGLDRGWRTARRRRAGSLVRERRNEVAAVEDGLQRVADQRIGPAHHRQEARPARRRSQGLGDVDEQPAAGLGHGPRSRHLPEGQAERLHGVGHHLLMADRDVDVVLSVALRGNWEQGGDWPALDNEKIVVDQAPFDVLGTAEVRFDPPAQLREPHDLRIRQRWLRLPLRLDRLLLRAACRRGVDGKLLGGNRPGDDLAVPHLVDVRVHQAGDQRLAEAEAGLHGGDLPVARDGVGREQDAGRLRENHLLHDHGHVDLAMVQAVPQAVGHGPLGEERGPTAADVLEDGGRPHDVQVRVLLAGEGGRRQVLRGRAGSDGVGGLLAEPGERAADRLRQVVRDGDRFDGPADLRAERADRLPLVRLQTRQPIEPIVDRRRVRHDPLEGVRRHAEASRHADAFHPRKFAQIRRPSANERDLRLVDLLESPTRNSSCAFLLCASSGVSQPPLELPPLQRATSYEVRGSTSCTQSLDFHSGTGVWHPSRGTKVERSTSCILCTYRGQFGKSSVIRTRVTSCASG